jgi:Zn-dependent M16 (insulinase) family peptidase
MTSKYLHGELREKNGAYGGGANYDATNGVFHFYTYRDPPPSSRTFKVYDSIPGWIREKLSLFGEQDLREAKLKILQQLDAPLNASQEGKGLFLSGIDVETRTAFRHSILDADLASIVVVAQKYFENEVYGESVIGERE